MARPVSRTRAHAVVQPLIPTNRALTRALRRSLQHKIFFVPVNRFTQTTYRPTRALRRSLQHKIFFVPVNRFTQTTYRPTRSAAPKIPPTRHVPWNQAAPLARGGTPTCTPKRDIHVPLFPSMSV